MSLMQERFSPRTDLADLLKVKDLRNWVRGSFAERTLNRARSRYWTESELEEFLREGGMKVYFYKNNKVAGIKVTAPFVWAIAIGIAFGAGTAAYEAFSEI